MRTALILAAALAAGMACADPPEIVAAEARAAGGAWGFSVTIRHPDTGWDHYADGWSVFAPDGTELGFRELLHPHETEQPFTRSLAGVEVPAGVTEVTIRARCSVDGWGEEAFSLQLGE
jgi:hypothetical protein